MTASKVILMVKGLQRIVANLSRQGQSTSKSDLLGKMQSEFEGRFSRVEDSHLLAEATIIDPRFKKAAFTDRAADSAFKGITAMAARVSVQTSRNEQEEDQAGNTPAPHVDAGGALFWQDFDQHIRTVKEQKPLC